MSIRMDKPVLQTKVAAGATSNPEAYAALNCKVCGEKLHLLFLNRATLAFCPGADLSGLEPIVSRLRNAETEERCVVSCRRRSGENPLESIRTD
ncbi:hypothetical protein [Photobacterium sp. TY1-4]|uniref:hypothetical protein n=1 Tax=Photobacterium sp. TY1-4 TaxID=2899122 RepID=UPI0021BEC667|nr:hypothetical protein [Photobacterium sp. TY1-4]UXI03788.1 hypothetical protein NH461_16825 [Photobacterium sp. TY1-4]